MVLRRGHATLVVIKGNRAIPIICLTLQDNQITCLEKYSVGCFPIHHRPRNASTLEGSTFMMIQRKCRNIPCRIHRKQRRKTNEAQVLGRGTFSNSNIVVRYFSGFASSFIPHLSLCKQEKFGGMHTDLMLVLSSVSWKPNSPKIYNVGQWWQTKSAVQICC
jgi:hypothetical protein